MANNTYENIDVPYLSNMERSEEGVTGLSDVPDITSVGANEVSNANFQADNYAQIISGKQFSDMWVETWIKSRNYRPNTGGFYLEASTGMSEFVGLLIGRNGITIRQSETGFNSTNALRIFNSSNYAAIDIRKSGIGNGIYIESTASTSLQIDQRSNTSAIKAIGYDILPGAGGVIEGVLERGDGNAGAPAILGRVQTGDGVGVFATVETTTGTSYPLHAEQNIPTNTNFYKISVYDGAGAVDIDTWIANNADPNGTLTGEIGDVCYSSNGKMYICQGGTVWTVQDAAAGDFGDGSDGTIVMDGTNTFSSFTSKVGNTYTLTRDLYADNLTVTSPGVLNPGGYHIFVKDTLTVGSGNRIQRNGNNGTSGGTSTAGTAGAALASGTLFGSLAGRNGTNGQTSVNTNGGDGTNGFSSTRGLVPGAAGFGYGGFSGNSGSGTSFGGLRGNLGTTNLSARKPRTAIYAQMMTDFDGGLLTGAAGAGSGAGGASGDGPNFGAGGGGGGSGSNGGIIVIHAKNISNSGVIRAEGGSGGGGGAGQTAGAGSSGGGGGGGGGAGAGGVIVVVTSVGQSTGTLSVAPGGSGNGGAAGGGPIGTATAGETAAPGLSGVTFTVTI